VWRWYVMSVAAAAVVGIGVGVLAHDEFAAGPARSATPALPTLHGQATWPRGKRIAPAFTLRDQHGRRVRFAAFQGRTVALTFMDSRCKSACPLEGRMIAAAIAAVPARYRPQLVVVSVNPAGDTPHTVAVAAHKWRLPAGSEWLLGTRAQLSRVWKDYEITVEPVAGDTVHSTVVYLIDAHGFERAAFLMPFVPGLVSTDLRALGAGTA
jgi:protein SCO1/2